MEFNTGKQNNSVEFPQSTNGTIDFAAGQRRSAGTTRNGIMPRITLISANAISGL